MMKPVFIACVICLGLSTAACERFGPGARSTQYSATQRCEGLSGSAFEQCRQNAEGQYLSRGTGGSEQSGAR